MQVRVIAAVATQLPNMPLVFFDAAAVAEDLWPEGSPPPTLFLETEGRR